MGLRDAVHKFSGGSPSKGDTGHKEGAPEVEQEFKDQEEVLDEETGNVLLALIAQLRPGMDLSRVALPTFVLEPRSMLERISDSLGHAELVFEAGQESDPIERFVQVVRYFLSGWHIKVPGVKKPYNPVLGEFFRCRYEYGNGTLGYYVAEQVSHHPPISAFYYVSPANEVEIYGELRPKSKFLGNSAATLMGGESKVRFLNQSKDGQYVISMPNMYARGILFGKMVFELGDECKVSNAANEAVCDLDFKTKGFFSGSYNAITGKIKVEGKELGEISGLWSEVMELKRHKAHKEVLFDARGAKPTPKIVAPEDQQEEFESRRLWSKVTAAIKQKDMKAATDNKVDIEEAQRERTAKREHSGETWSPRFFLHRGDEFLPTFSLPEQESERIPAVHKWIFGDQSTPPQSEPAVSGGKTADRASTIQAAEDSAQSSAPVATTATPASKGASGALDASLPGKSQTAAASRRIPS